MTNLDSILKKQRRYFAKKGTSSQGFGLSSSHVWMCDLDYKESWAPKDWCFKLWCWRRLLDLKKRVSLIGDLESPLDCKEVYPVHPKEDQSWVFLGRTDVEGETPILWPPDAKCWLIWIDPDDGKDWRWEEKGATEDKMVGWHHWLDRHEFG